MSHYVIIESREPDDSFGDDEFTDWVAELIKLGHTATVFLTQNAVIAARKGCVYNAGVSRLQEADARVLVDGFYATEKSIDSYAAGVEAAEMDRVVDLILSDDARPVWH